MSGEGGYICGCKKKSDNHPIAHNRMTISSLDIPHSSDELHKQAPMQAFGDLVVKNTPPLFNS